MDKIIKQLVKNTSDVFTKVVKFIYHNDTEQVDYTINVNGTDVYYADARPLNYAQTFDDNGNVISDNTIYKIQLSLDNTNVTIPKVDSYGIIIFTTPQNPYVLSLATPSTFKRTITNEDGSTTVAEVKIENGKSVLDITADTVEMKTAKGGFLTIINKNVTIGDVNKCRFQITDVDGSVLNEIIIDKNDGISLNSYNNTPIEIKNSAGNLKDVLIDMINSFLNATYVSPTGTATINTGSPSVVKLKDVKEQIKMLLK